MQLLTVTSADLAGEAQSATQVHQLMWLFRRRGHRFRKSSLSNSVPLDGSETVPGLRQLDRSRRSQDLHSFLETNLSGKLVRWRPARRGQRIVFASSAGNKA